jgi:predicted dehydrogenase
MADRLRAGVVGAGFIGGVHAHAVHAAGGVVARVAASSPDRASRAAERIGAEKAASCAEELIESADVDVVHICSPNSTHVALARRALAAGKHVICEKPLAVDVEEARKLAAAAAEAGRLAAVPFVYRYYPSVREAQARIAHGDAGPMQLLHGAYLQDWQIGGADPGWRADARQGGAVRAFADIGVHWCDLMEFTTGHRITRLIAQVFGSGNRTTVLFNTDRGVPGSLVVSQIAAGRKNQLWFSFDGAEESYIFDQQAPETLWTGGSRENRVTYRGQFERSAQAAEFSSLPPGHPQGYQACFNAFIADAYAAANGVLTDGMPDFADGARAAEITAAVACSARTEAWREVG